MKSELLEYHQKELADAISKRSSWVNGPNPEPFPKTAQEHVEFFDALVTFHKRAVQWLNPNNVDHK